MSSITGGLAHAAVGGVGLGYLLGFNPMLGATVFGLLSGLGVGVAYRRLGSALDTAVSMFWSAGMALGVMFVALAPGYAPDLTTYLFGSILFASWSYVLGVALLDLIILAIVWLLYRPLEAVSFDEEFSDVVGLPVDRLLLILLALVALSVVTLIQVVGIILGIALLTIPAEAARPWSSTLRRMMVLATAVGASCATLGVLVSYTLSDRFAVSVPTGPLIILLCLIVYGLSRLLHRFSRRGTVGSAPAEGR
jgi:zinc transport system permease protein